MLNIHIIFSDPKDAYRANTKVCEFFQGSKAFIENDIVVTPVKTETPDDDKKFWAFDISFYDSEIEKNITLSSGELSIMGIKKVWAFNKLENYVASKDESE